MSILNLKVSYNKFSNTSTYISFLLAFTQGLSALVFILIDFLFSKRLSVSEFGEWKQIYFVVALSIPLLSFGIPEGCKYYFAKDRKVKELFSNTFLFVSFITIGLFILSVCLNLLHHQGLLDLNHFYLISLLFPIAYFAFVMSKTLRYAYINERKVKMFTNINILYSIVIFLLLMVVYFLFQEIKEYYLLIGILLFICIFGLSNPTLRYKLNLPVRIKWLSKDLFLRVITQGFPLYLATFIGTLSINLDKTIVSTFENKETFAIFSVGALEIPIFAMLSAAFSQNIFPQLVTLIDQNKKEEAKKIWIQTTKKVSMITFPIILILMFFAKEIIFYIYSSEYESAVFLFQSYLLVGLLRNNSYGALIAAAGKAKYITLYSLMMLVFNLIFSIILYNFLGIIGVIYGSLASTLLIAILQMKHEGLLKMYFNEILLSPKILALIILILGYYFYKCI